MSVHTDSCARVSTCAAYAVFIFEEDGGVWELCGWRYTVPYHGEGIAAALASQHLVKLATAHPGNAYQVRPCQMWVH